MSDHRSKFENGKMRSMPTDARLTKENWSSTVDLYDEGDEAEQGEQENYQGGTHRDIKPTLYGLLIRREGFWKYSQAGYSCKGYDCARRPPTSMWCINQNVNGEWRQMSRQGGQFRITSNSANERNVRR
jgi:hypothetical protein